MQAYIIYGVNDGHYDVDVAVASSTAPYAAILQNGEWRPLGLLSGIAGISLRLAENDTFVLRVVDGDWLMDYHQVTYTAASGEITDSDAHNIDTSYTLII